MHAHAHADAPQFSLRHYCNSKQLRGAVPSGSDVCSIGINATTPSHTPNTSMQIAHFPLSSSWCSPHQPLSSYTATHSIEAEQKELIILHNLGLPEIRALWSLLRNLIIYRNMWPSSGVRLFLHVYSKFIVISIN